MREGGGSRRVPVQPSCCPLRWLGARTSQTVVRVVVFSTFLDEGARLRMPSLRKHATRRSMLLLAPVTAPPPLANVEVVRQPRGGCPHQHLTPASLLSQLELQMHRPSLPLSPLVLWTKASPKRRARRAAPSRPALPKCATMMITVAWDPWACRPDST